MIATRDDAREYFARKGVRYTSDPDRMISYPIHWGDIMRLWQMCEDAIATVLGWGAKYNEIGGYKADDLSQYPMATAKEFIDRMHMLGYTKEGWSL